MESWTVLSDNLQTATLGLLYIRNVSSTCHTHVRHVPDYVRQAVPVFLLLTLAEFLFLQTRRSGRSSFADHVVSLAQGLAHLTVSTCAGFVPVWLYAAVWRHWAVFDLPADSAATWWLAAIGVDFCFYWQHRTLHEVNLFWAMHQAHHSSEYFNLSAAQRQPVLQTLVTGWFYLPLAVLGVPPAAWLTHRAFNFIYQFWIHTETVGRLGVLEEVLNTASHHRVHHASNPEYLDRNYGGVLILWDRLFGTFCRERQPPTYGLVHNVDTFSLWPVQLGSYAALLAAARREATWTDTTRRLLYGPGWQPGGPRLGDPTAVPQPDPRRRKHASTARATLILYAFTHFSLVGLVLLAGARLSSPPVAALLLLSATSFTTLLEGTSWAPRLETGRCLAVAVWLLVVVEVKSAVLTVGGMVVFGGSAVLWAMCPNSVWWQTLA